MNEKVIQRINKIGTQRRPTKNTRYRKIKDISKHRKLKAGLNTIIIYHKKMWNITKCGTFFTATENFLNIKKD